MASRSTAQIDEAPTDPVQPKAVPPPDLAHWLRDAEMQLFVGRQPELAALEQALEDARSRPVVVYVHGPAGVGKSALLAAFARRVAKRTLLFNLHGPSLESAREHLAQEVSRTFGLTETGSTGLGDVATALSAAGARQGPLAVLLDGYDLLGGNEPRLRQEFLYALQKGLCVVLAGRLAPEALWPGERAWRAEIRSLPLGALPFEEAARFLDQVPLPPDRAESILQGVVEMTDGRPHWLAVAADALARFVRTPHPTAASSGWMPKDDRAVDLFLLEHLLHPRSRRHAWRPGAGESVVDKALAVAALFRTFDRTDLSSVLGTEVDRKSWEEIADLPFVHAVGPRCTLKEGVRGTIREALAAQRPWCDYSWRRRAIERRLSQSASLTAAQAGAFCWSDLVDLAKESPWHRWLVPDAPARSPWRVQRGALPSDLSALMRCAARALGDRPAAAVTAVDPRLLGSVRNDRGHLILVKDREDVVGFCTLQSVDLDRDRPGAPAPALACATLAVADMVAAPHETRVCGTLLREACGDLMAFDGILVRLPATGPAIDWAGRVLPLMGFRGGAHADAVEAAVRPHLPERASVAWFLDLKATGHLRWLSDLVKTTAEPLPPKSRAAAAREALERLHDPAALEGTAAARYVAARFGTASARWVRSWLLDALRSADLGPPGLYGRTLLTMYYVDRAGSHEWVAEKLHLSRPTYFRDHRLALARLGDALFGG